MSRSPAQSSPIQPVGSLSVQPGGSKTPDNWTLDETDETPQCSIVTLTEQGQSQPEQHSRCSPGPAPTDNAADLTDEGRFIVERFGRRWAVCDLARPNQQLWIHDTQQQQQAEVARRGAGTRRNARTTRTGRTLT